MNALRAALAKLLGLFVEDRTFALAIAVWLAVCGGLAYSHAAGAAVPGIALFAGMALILVASVARAARSGS